MIRFYNIFILFTLLLLSCNSDEDKDIISDINDLSVEIISPINKQAFSPNSIIEFKGQISSPNLKDFSTLKAIWVSDIYGTLNESTIDENGETKFSTSNLSKNIHFIRLNIYNEIDEIVYDEIIVYNSIWLYPVTDKKNTSSISWSKTEDLSFDSYDVYRSPYKNNINNKKDDLIYSTTNINDTTFIDSNAYLATKYYYKVFLKRTTKSPIYVGSNIDSITLGNFKKLDYPISKIIKDPNRNYAYGIVNIDNIYSTNSTGYGLSFINVENKEVKRILTNYRFTDIDIDPSGNYLYLCSRSNVIQKVNLNTRQLESSFSLLRPAHKIEIGINNKLYYHITPPTSGSTEFRIYDLTNNTDIYYKTTIPAAYSSFSHGDFELDNNQNIYHGESNTSSSFLTKIGTTNDTFSIVEQISSGSYQRAGVTLNNNKIYWNNYLFDSNLKRIGVFKDEGNDVDIQTVSPNGNLALGSARLYDTNNFNIMKKIAINYDIATFTKDNQILFVKNENKISNVNTSTLFFYDF
ncbi:YncE family protein [Polaribacter sp. 20A6]|uniref:YncE family protein n=1 Tax=Polaribacter sp. 20A6 TaxID=2687289 RepID=UPI0013FD8252|nr:hypothetical protein [Polaribacter sp. 20A6]